MGECKEIRVLNAKWMVYNLELEKTAYTFVLLLKLIFTTKTYMRLWKNGYILKNLSLSLK